MSASCSSGSTEAPKAPNDEAAPTSPAADEASKSEEPTGAEITGDAIQAWFDGRGGKMPGALDPTQTECRTVSAPVPSGQALWCEQRSAIQPWVQMTRTILYDVRDGRTLLLVNLLSRVAAGEAASGKGCAGALVALKIELGAAGKSLTVADDPECACAGAADRVAAAKNVAKANSAEAREHQSRQVQAACAELGNYKWEEHGYEPVK